VLGRLFLLGSAAPLAAADLDLGAQRLGAWFFALGAEANIRGFLAG
jgi:hypothetical protein